MYRRLAYKFEGMTDMINGAFMEDLSELLNAATGDQRRRKSFYEIDTEFEKMRASLLKNFNSMASLMPFLRPSLRQTMIRKLATVGKDKDGWKKADEHLTTLMDQEHMITIEDTDAERESVVYWYSISDPLHFHVFAGLGRDSSCLMSVVSCKYAPRRS